MLKKLTLMLVAAATIGATAAQAGGLDQAAFDEWISTRFGDGEPVYWYGTGETLAYPSGEVLYRFEFVDEARLYVDPKNPAVKYGLDRKFNLFLDKDTGEVLRTFRGNAVPQRIYPYQLIEMRLQDGKANAVATQGAGANLRRIAFDDVVNAHRFGDSVHFIAPAVFHTKRPEGDVISDLDTLEFLTYVALPPTTPPGTSRYRFHVTLGMQRSAWAGGNGEDYEFSNFTGVRYATYAELPEHVRRFIESEAPLFRAPPKDMEEIRRLQADSQ